MLPRLPDFPQPKTDSSSNPEEILQNNIFEEDDEDEDIENRFKPRMDISVMDLVVKNFDYQAASSYMEKDFENKYGFLKKDNPISTHIEQIKTRVDPSGKLLKRINVLENCNHSEGCILPDGTVILSLPLVALCDSDDEIAGILAHEAIHIKENHQEVKKNAKTLKEAIGLKRIGEYEADILSVIDLMKSSGYQPLALAGLFSKMERQKEGGWTTSHGSLTDRSLNILSVSHLLDIDNIDSAQTIIPEEIKKSIKNLKSSSSETKDYDERLIEIKYGNQDFVQLVDKLKNNPEAADWLGAVEVINSLLPEVLKHLNRIIKKELHIKNRTTIKFELDRFCKHKLMIIQSILRAMYQKVLGVVQDEVRTKVSLYSILYFYTNFSLPNQLFQDTSATKPSIGNSSLFDILEIDLSGNTSFINALSQSVLDQDTKVIVDCLTNQELAQLKLSQSFQYQLQDRLGSFNKFCNNHLEIYNNLDTDEFELDLLNTQSNDLLDSLEEKATYFGHAPLPLALYKYQLFEESAEAENEIADLDPTDPKNKFILEIDRKENISPETKNQELEILYHELTPLYALNNIEEISNFIQNNNLFEKINRYRGRLNDTLEYGKLESLGDKALYLITKVLFVLWVHDPAFNNYTDLTALVEETIDIEGPIYLECSILQHFESELWSSTEHANEWKIENRRNYRDEFLTYFNKVLPLIRIINQKYRAKSMPNWAWNNNCEKVLYALHQKIEDLIDRESPEFAEILKEFPDLINFSRYQINFKSNLLGKVNSGERLDFIQTQLSSPEDSFLVSKFIIDPIARSAYERWKNSSLLENAGRQELIRTFQNKNLDVAVRTKAFEILIERKSRTQTELEEAMALGVLAYNSEKMEKTAELVSLDEFLTFIYKRNLELVETGIASGSDESGLAELLLKDWYESRTKIPDFVESLDMGRILDFSAAQMEKWILERRIRRNITTMKSGTDGDYSEDSEDYNIDYISPVAGLQKIYRSSLATKHAISRKILTTPKTGLFNHKVGIINVFDNFSKIRLNLGENEKVLLDSVISAMTNCLSVEEWYLTIGPFISNNIFQQPAEPADYFKVCYEYVTKLFQSVYPRFFESDNLPDLSTFKFNVEVFEEKLLKHGIDPENLEENDEMDFNEEFDDHHPDISDDEQITWETKYNLPQFGEMTLGQIVAMRFCLLTFGDPRQTYVQAGSKIENLYQQIPEEFKNPKQQGALNGMEAMVDAFQRIGSLGVRFLQLLGQYIDIKPENAEAFSKVYDSNKGQSKIAAYQTIKRELGDLLHPEMELGDNVGGGSLLTVYEYFDGVDNRKKVIKVLNPNAIYHLKKNGEVIQKIVAKLCEDHPDNEQFRMVRDFLIPDLLEWLEQDIKDEKFQELDRDFKQKWDGFGQNPPFNYPNHNYSIYVPEVYEPQNRFIKIEEWIEGKNITEWKIGDKFDYEAGILEPEQYKQVVSLITKHHMEQLRDGIVHSDVHKGNFRITPDNKIAVLDRNNYLEFTEPEDRGLLKNLLGGFKSETIIDYLLKMPENESLKENKDSILTNINLITQNAGEVNEDLIRKIVLESKVLGLKVPLKLTLLFKNLLSLNKMAREAGFDNFVGAYLWNQPLSFYGNVAADKARGFVQGAIDRLKGK